MDWTMKEERQELQRMIALLLSLASLAELASRRSPAVRGFVLWLLRRAETVALRLVAAMPDRSPAPLFAGAAGSSVAEAMRLAKRFRALARRLRREAILVCAARGDDSADIEPPRFTARAMNDVARLARAMRSSAAPARNLACGLQVPDSS